MGAFAHSFVLLFLRISICWHLVFTQNLLSVIPCVGTEDAGMGDPNSVFKELIVRRGSRRTWALEADETEIQCSLDPSLWPSPATAPQPGCCEDQRRSC